MIDSSRHDQVMDLFDRVCDLDVDGRKELLDQECADDPALRSEVESLLAYDDTDNEAIRAVEQEAGAKIIEGASLSDDDNGVPAQIGQYKVVRLIGQGGMGRVFEARQEFPSRKVAVKVLRHGYVSDQLIRRFRREAEVLAQMQHVGIAHIYEAGVSQDNGREQPFLAMEYIEGAPLDKFVRTNNLDRRSILALFVRICDAVQHAHQKGVTHRDLKPGNILVQQAQPVSLDDADTTGLEADSIFDRVGIPKILDFGIARVTGADMQVTTLQTEVGQIIGTLGYMSPEQVIGDLNGIDTRSDIYSLGVILYELLAQQPAFEMRGFGVAQAARVICDSSPKPLGKVDRTLRGDIETIVLKAMEKEPNQRYATAAQFATDIRRYLSDIPIEARPASAYYQLRKFSKRNKGLVTGVAMAFVAIVMGLGFATYGFVAASRQRDIALEERDAKDTALAAELQARQASDAVTNFFTEMLEQAAPNAGGKDVTVREVIDLAGETIDDKFDDQPLIEARIRHTMGSTYLALSEFELAGLQLQQAADIRESNADSKPADKLLTQFMFAQLSIYQDRHAEGVEIITDVLNSADEQSIDDIPRGTMLTMRALAYMRLAKLPEAERDLDAGIKMLIEKHGPDSPDVLEAQSLMAEYISKVRPDEAENYYLDLIERSERIRGADHPETLMLKGNLGTYYRFTQKPQKAVEVLTDVYEQQGRVLGPAHRQTLLSLNNLTRSMTRIGQRDQALSMIEDGIALSIDAHGEESSTTVFLVYAKARIMLRSKDLAATEEVLKYSLDLSRRVNGPSSTNTWYAEQDLLKFYLRTRRDNEAIELGRAVYERLRDSSDSSGLRLAESQFYFAFAYLNAKRYEDAEPLLVAAYESADAPASLRTAIHGRLVRLYEVMGQPDKAAEWRAKSPDS